MYFISTFYQQQIPRDTEDDDVILLQLNIQIILLQAKTFSVHLYDKYLIFNVSAPMLKVSLCIHAMSLLWGEIGSTQQPYQVRQSGLNKDCRTK